MLGPQEPQLVVLPVNGELSAGELPQQPDRDRPSTQMCPRAAVGVDGADGDDGAILVEFCP